MSKRSEAVKRWRSNTKTRIVKAMGGACVICGYNRCQSSLHLHHLDQSKKEFSFSSIRANCKSWSKIVEELRKCVLVCANCHGEIHEGLAVVPLDVPLFNEDFTEYDNGSQIQTPCVVCGKLKPERQITCSRQCSAKRRCKIDWSKYDLREMSETMTRTEIAEVIGVSDAAVSKRMKRIGCE